jgi:hypothetical protein
MAGHMDISVLPSVIRFNRRGYVISYVHKTKRRGQNKPNHLYQRIFKSFTGVAQTDLLPILSVNSESMEVEGVMSTSIDMLMISPLFIL